MTLSAPPSSPSLATAPAPSPTKALRRLFLTLFLRGRNARGLRMQSAPKSVASKLTLILIFYGLFGALSISFLHQPVFILAIFLHAMTFVFLGMFISSSAGEVLFNKEEGDILLHRPVTPRALLWAKISVLVEISLWIAGAFNAVGMVAGVFSLNGDWRFPLVHAISTTLEALFCTACVVMVYQLCIRWFGRERLESLMTTTQVLISIAAVLSGQILPQIAFRFSGVAVAVQHSWWMALLPPAWFAGFDDAFAGSMSPLSVLLALAALLATSAVLWIAFSKLARDYEHGLQSLSENISPSPSARQRRRWLDALVNAQPLRWWLRDPVTRAAFLLTTAYLTRDREVKLRIYPAIAPMLVIPFLFLIRNGNANGAPSSDFGATFVGAYLGVIPMIAINILQFSQQWQASDVFRVAPIAGPGAISHGTRRAVLCFITLPVILVVTLFTWVVHHNPYHLLMLLPGILVIPIYSLIPALRGRGTPFSQPAEEGKSASRGLSMMGAMFFSFALAGLASLAHSFGLFPWFLLAELLVVLACYIPMHRALARKPWPSLE